MKLYELIDNIQIDSPVIIRMWDDNGQHLLSSKALENLTEKEHATIYNADIKYLFAELVNGKPAIMIEYGGN